MKVVILAGGLGTRILEESQFKPKPMINIGDVPILWHVMKIFYHQGYNDFIICAGYKPDHIKHFFKNYALSKSDVCIDFSNNKFELINNKSEKWKVTVVDTGINTMTGGRLKRVSEYIDDTFFMTYGDGVGDVDLNKLLKFHKENNFKATLTSVNQPGRFGELELDNHLVKSFKEKPKSDSQINAGFFVLEPSVFDYIKGDDEIWERSPLENLAKEKSLGAYFHKGFWFPMDSLKDKKYLQDLILSNKAPWITWEE